MLGVTSESLGSSPYPSVSPTLAYEKLSSRLVSEVSSRYQNEKLNTIFLSLSTQ